MCRLFNDPNLSKIVTRKWIEVNDLYNSQYFVNKNIRFKTAMLRSNLFGYSDVYLPAEVTIDLK